MPDLLPASWGAFIDRQESLTPILANIKQDICIPRTEIWGCVVVSYGTKTYHDTYHDMTWHCTIFGPNAKLLHHQRNERRAEQRRMQITLMIPQLTPINTAKRLTTSRKNYTCTRQSSSLRLKRNNDLLYTPTGCLMMKTCSRNTVITTRRGRDLRGTVMMLAAETTCAAWGIPTPRQLEGVGSSSDGGNSWGWKQGMKLINI